MGIRKKKVVEKLEKTLDKTYKIKTIEIEESISRLFNIRQYIIVPNVSWGFHGGHEMDLFIISPSKYAYEVEIKISVSDFRADFKKNHTHESKYIREFYYAMPDYIYEKIKLEIPEHAGIIVCDVFRGNVNSKIIRKPKINSVAKKLSEVDQLKIMRLGCMRIMPLKKKIIKLQNDIVDLKKL